MNTKFQDNIKLTEISELAYNWLVALGQKVDKTFIKHEILTHPDYPALTSLCDLLDAGNFDYIACHTSLEDIKDIYFPCVVNLALPDTRNGLSVVNNRKEFETILKFWTGIVLYTFPGSSWVHPVNKRYFSQNRKNTYHFFSFAALLFATSTVWGIALNHSIWLLSSAFGILACLLLTAKEIGLESEFTQKVCGLNRNGTGCESVLNSRNAQGKFGISITMIALSYFICQWLLFMTAPFFPFSAITSESIPSIAYMNILVILWSTVTQKYIIKKWCVLCLIIVTLLLIQFLLALFTKNKFAIEGGFYFGLTFLILLVPLKLISTLLAKLKQIEVKERELSKWKRDTYLFINQWNSQLEVDCNPIIEELELANPNATLQFTVACNPFCQPCAKIHRQIDQIIETYGEYISIKVRFSIANDETNELTNAANLIINAARAYKNTRVIIHEWFKYMNSDFFRSKFPLSNSKNDNQILCLHTEWSRKANIVYTPTIFLNNKELPKRYSLSDVAAMIPELYDQKKQ